MTQIRQPGDTRPILDIIRERRARLAALDPVDTAEAALDDDADAYRDRCTD